MQGGNGENDRAGVGGDPRGRSLLLLHPPPAALNSLPTLSRPVERRTASVGGGDCPPSCQPIPAHCRASRFPPTVVAANRGTSSKPARFIRRWRRFADFPDAPPPATHRTLDPCVGRGALTPPPKRTVPLVKKPVIANQPADWCGNPYSSRVVRCRKGNTDSHVASLLGMTFCENAVFVDGRGRAAAPTHVLQISL